jgi:hypothetical protein
MLLLIWKPATKKPVAICEFRDDRNWRDRLQSRGESWRRIGLQKCCTNTLPPLGLPQWFNGFCTTLPAEFSKLRGQVVQSSFFAVIRQKMNFSG